MKYEIWLEQWLENYVKTALKPRTYVRYHETVRHHISPALGQHEICKITPLLIQKFIAELIENGNVLTGAGLAINSVNLVITVLKSSFKTAAANGLCEKSPAEHIVRPRPKEKKIYSFTQYEQKLIENHILSCGLDRMRGVILCLYSGLRIGELLALEWSDIDFEKGLIHVTKTCYDGRDENGNFKVVTGSPKTFSSTRSIPPPPQLLPLLRKMRDTSPGKFVVSDKLGRQLSCRSYQKSFELLQKRINITPYHNFHSLRHTFATRALESGMDVKTLADILGHKNPTVTLKRYAHSMLEHKRDVMSRLGEIFY